jgi:sugar diacid utilization regulator
MRTRPRTASPPLRKLVEQASRSRERQVREIVALCQRRYPHYRALSGAALEGLRRNVRYLVAGFYRRAVIEGRAPTGAELDTSIQAARLRAAQGVPFGDMVGCYLQALPFLWQRLLARARTDPTVSQELLQRVPVTYSAMTLVITAVTEAYVEERERLLHSRGQALEEFARLLLEADAPVAVLEPRARAIGIRLEAMRSVVLLRPTVQDAVTSEPEIEMVRRALSDATSPPPVVARSQEGMLVLLAVEADRAHLEGVVRRLPDAGWRVGIGGPATDAAGLRRSASEARRALELGSLRDPRERVHAYADLAVLDLVGVGSLRAEEFARRVLGPLAGPGNTGTQRKTLAAVCRHGYRLKQAAAALGIHPHTLSYRLSRIRTRFGIDLEDADTRLRVQLALVILDPAAWTADA